MKKHEKFLLQINSDYSVGIDGIDIEIELPNFKYLSKENKDFILESLENIASVYDDGAGYKIIHLNKEESEK